MSTPTMPAVRHFSRYAADLIWWYHPTGPIEVSVNGGTFVGCTAGTDPKGRAGFKAYFAGPNSGRSGIPLLLGDNALVARSPGDPQSAVVTTFLVE